VCWGKKQQKYLRRRLIDLAAPVGRACFSWETPPREWNKKDKALMELAKVVNAVTGFAHASRTAI